MSPSGRVWNVEGDSRFRGTLFVLFGAVFGLGMFTFLFAEGTSYFSDEPEACVNCHIMRGQYDGWQHASHREVAVCNTCHTPKGTLSKWTVKAIHGWNHSVAFTTGRFEEPIRMHALSARVVQDNCLQCHADLVDNLHRSGTSSPVPCATCHSEVGHVR